MSAEKTAATKAEVFDFRVLQQPAREIAAMAVSTVLTGEVSREKGWVGTPWCIQRGQDAVETQRLCDRLRAVDI